MLSLPLPNRKTFSLFVILTLLLAGCDPVDLRMKIVNKSNSSVYFTTTSTSLELYSPLIKDTNFSLIRIGDTVVYPKMGTWEGMLPTDTLYFVFFDADSIKHIPFDIIKRKRYYRLVAKTLGQIKENNWFIEYK